MNKSDQLETLKRIILEDDRNSIKDILSQLQSIEKEIKQNQDSMKGVVNDEIQSSIKRKIIPQVNNFYKKQPEEIVDSLYPSIGSMIAKYLAESIAELQENINTTINNQVPIEKWKTVFLSKVTGRPAQTFILDKIDTSVNAILMIDSQSGMLVERFDGDGNDDFSLPESMFASMLTALTHFGKELTENKDQQLNELNYGKYYILIEQMGSMYFAIISPNTLSIKSKKLLRSLLQNELANHKDDFLNTKDLGNVKTPEDLKENLNDLIKKSQIEKKKSRFKKGAILLLLLIIFLIWFSHRQYIKYKVADLASKNTYVSEIITNSRLDWLNRPTVEFKTKNKLLRNVVTNFFSRNDQLKISLANINADNQVITKLDYIVANFIESLKNRNDVSNVSTSVRDNFIIIKITSSKDLAVDKLVNELDEYGLAQLIKLEIENL